MLTHMTELASFQKLVVIAVRAYVEVVLMTGMTKPQFYPIDYFGSSCK